MKIEWDPQKNAINIEKRGIDFRDAELVLTGATIHVLDDRREYGESRWVAYGLLVDVIVVVVYTVRGDTLRIISMRRANKRERRKYEQKIYEEASAS